MSKETRHLILEMTAGNVIFEAVLAIGAVLLGSRLGAPLPSVFLGLALGLAADVVMLVHMAIITERIVDAADQGYANKTTVIHAMIRRLLLIVCVILLWRFVPQVNLVAFIIGALGLKAGAYLQPFIHRAFSK